MTTPQEIWQRATIAQDIAQAAYPDLRCRSGCNDCCKNHGSPITYVQEWQVIAEHLDQQADLKAAVQQSYLSLKQSLRQRLQTLQTPSLSAALFDVPCPFIADEACSIYALRPLTCRAFGNSVLQSPPLSGDDIYTCNPEKDRWETDLPMKVESPLPLRAELFKELEQSGQSRSLLSFLEGYFHESR